MNQAKTISTIVPVYNAEKFIAAALDSILQQTRQSDEIIVINDGSTDNTLDIVKSYKGVTVISQENKGITATLNKGIASATGDYLSFLDADDLWHPEKNEMQLQYLRENPHIDMVFGHIVQFSDSTGEASQAQLGLTKITLLMERQKFLRVGLFDNLVSGDFIAWFQRAVHLGLKYAMIPEILARRRVHNHNFTQSVGYNKHLPLLAKTLIQQKRKQHA